MCMDFHPRSIKTLAFSGLTFQIETWMAIKGIRPSFGGGTNVLFFCFVFKFKMFSS